MKAITDEQLAALQEGADGDQPGLVIFNNIFVQFENPGQAVKHCISGPPQSTYGQFCEIAIGRLAEKNILVGQLFVGVGGALNTPPAGTLLSVIQEQYADPMTGIVTMTYF